MDTREVLASARPAEPEGVGAGTRRAARNAAILSAAEVAGKIATVAFTVAAARALGRADFGLFSFALSLSLLVATLPSGGFGAVLVQQGSAEPRRLSQLFSELLVWRTAIAVPVFAAMAVAGVVTQAGTSSAVAFLLVLAATTVDLFSDAGRSAAGAIQRQVGVSVALVVQRFAAAGLAIAALAAGFGLVGLAAAYLAGAVIGALGVLVSVRRLGISFDLRLVRREGFLRMGRLSVALGIDTVVSLALFRVDQVMLGAMKGNAAVGQYAATYKLLETVLFVSWAMARAVFPVMSASSERWRVRRGVEQGIAAVALLYVPFGVALFIDAHPILNTLYGASYANGAVPIARWLAPSPLLFAIGYLGSYGLLARDRRWWAAWATIVTTVFNVGLNFVLIPRLSGTGAAMTTTLSYALESVLVLAMCFNAIGWVRVHRALLVPMLASAVMAGALLLSPSGTLVQVGVGLGAYAPTYLVLARWLAPEHLAVLRSLLPGRA